MWTPFVSGLTYLSIEQCTFSCLMLLLLLLILILLM